MKKREFIKTSAILGVGSMVTPLSSCKQESKAGEDTTEDKKENSDAKSTTGGAFVLPELPYEKSALEPYIDEMTMGIHHGKHHAGYVRKLNAALTTDSDFTGKSLNEIVSAVTEDDTALRNNGGGHYNHSLFWNILKPGGGSEPTGVLAEALNSTFGSIDKLSEELSSKAATQFGSGWGWLSVDGEGKLFVSSTPNQDNPMMRNLVERSGTPILGVDVWEHAYYLKYQNKRKEYLSNFLKIINWEQVAKNYSALI